MFLNINATLASVIRVFISVYKNQASYEYSVQYSLPQTTINYYSSAFYEVNNFSSIFSGVSNSFLLSTQFIETNGKPLKVVRATDKVNNWTNTSKPDFQNFQRDAYDYIITSNASKITFCEDYFSDCSQMASSNYMYNITMNSKNRKEYFLLVPMMKAKSSKPKSLQTSRVMQHAEADHQIVPAMKETGTSATGKERVRQVQQIKQTTGGADPIGVSFKSTGTVWINHFKISNSFFYMLIVAGALHSSILLTNIIRLILKRNKLKKRIEKYKTH